MHEPRQERRRRILFRLALVPLVLGATLAASEVVLRAAGRGPWAQAPRTATDPRLYRSDPVLGWTKIPGTHRIAAYAEGGSDFTMTFLPDNRRLSGRSEPRAGRRVLLIGGSFTQGFGVSDDETFAWKLQQRFPGTEFMNYGTGGYGTYQSLLLLERWLAEHDRAPVAVIYGFIAHHEHRNVADWSWVDLLTRYSHRGLVEIPYCTLGPDGGLVRNAPISYPRLPGREYLASVAFAEHLMLRFRTRGRMQQRAEVTDRLLVEMAAVCRKAGSELIVAILQSPARARASRLRLLARKRIAAVDCTHPQAASPEMRVPGEGHPNARMHAYWADCLEPALRSRLPAANNG